MNGQAIQTCDTCNGGCCEVITLHATKRYMTKAAVARGVRAGDCGGAPLWWLRLLRFVEKNEGQPVYRCLAHDKQNGGCTIYDRRPTACRGYECREGEASRWQPKPGDGIDGR